MSRVVSRGFAPRMAPACRAMSSQQQVQPVVQLDQEFLAQFPPEKQAELKELSYGHDSVENYMEENLRDRTNGDQTGRTFAYLMTGTTKALYASVGRMAVIKAVSYFSASADVVALASLEVDLGKVEVGSTMTVKWRGKPVFIRHRTDKEVSAAEADDNSEMRDPQKDIDRVQKPEWMIVLGVCTHLGCVPIGSAGEYGGWFCPCHGSHYDVSGRIRKGPAPLNLEVPPYSFLTESRIKLG